MSIQDNPLYEFIALVPSCYDTTPVIDVVTLLNGEKHPQQLVVKDKQEIPIGLMNLRNLLLQVVSEKQDEIENKEKFDWFQPISNLDSVAIQPIQTLSSSLSLKQFGSLLRSQRLRLVSQDWVLVDRYGKFLGLLDSFRLLQHLALSDKKNESVAISSGYQQTGVYQEVGNRISVISRTKINNQPADNAKTMRSADTNNQIHDGNSGDNSSQMGYKYAAQLLKGLPWALMLETGTKEVVSQNPLWYELFGKLKDPEGLQELWEQTIEGNVISQTEIQPEVSALNRCFIDSEPGSCVCIVEMRDGQERVWRFAKIPLEITEGNIPNFANQGKWDSSVEKLHEREFIAPVSDTKSQSEDRQLWLVLATDITEQQQLTQELAAKNADLIQLNRLKDEFLACISHELKTPLTAVLGLSRLLSDQQLGTLNDRQARYAQLIHQSGRHLMSVVNDILDLTRMETGQMTLTPVKVNIRRVCDRALKEAKEIHAQTTKATPSELDEEYQLILDIELGLEEIVADELRLRQMLVHLLSNAFKFTEAGGEIGLHVNRWEGWIAFTVWDTGIGIPESQQHLIFQKFQQLENPMIRQHEGTGLGLVLTRALARLHGGDVSFLSREGSGSKFTLLLPPSPPNKIVGEIGLNDTEEFVDSSNAQITEDTLLRGSASLPEKYEENTAISQHNLKLSKNQDQTVSGLPTYDHSLILVVETVAGYIEDFTSYLSALGYRFVIARSGCEALEKARRLQPTAIFINPLVPLLSGWDVLTLIKSDAATRNIPAIVMASAAEKEQAFSKRADYFLSLPVQYQALAGLLENLSTTPKFKPVDTKSCDPTQAKTPLKILRLVEPEIESLSYHPSLGKHRVIEVDDLEQAQLLARVWNFDVVLLDVEMPLAQTYLQQISKNKILAALPLVTCSVETTQAASKIAQLSVFPCLTELSKDDSAHKDKAPALLSVLQIAAGVCCPPNILVVDLKNLPDLPGEIIKSETKETTKNDRKSVNLPCSTKIPCPLNKETQTNSPPTEWFQALVQYLQTAGFKAAMCHTWEELLQQLRHESVDLLLICLAESAIKLKVKSVLEALAEMALDLPPLLLLDQRLNSDRVELETFETSEIISETIATEVLPRSISMENLLNRINQALSINNYQ